MSKHNKVNKNNYVQGGRLTPDEMARERIKQAELTSHSKQKENVIGKTDDRSGAPASNRSRTGREE
jgi:hypothetical protein